MEVAREKISFCLLNHFRKKRAALQKSLCRSFGHQGRWRSIPRPCNCRTPVVVDYLRYDNQPHGGAGFFRPQVLTQSLFKDFDRGANRIRPVGLPYMCINCCCPHDYRYEWLAFELRPESSLESWPCRGMKLLRIADWNAPAQSLEPMGH